MWYFYVPCAIDTGISYFQRHLTTSNRSFQFLNNGGREAVLLNLLFLTGSCGLQCFHPLDLVNVMETTEKLCRSFSLILWEGELVWRKSGFEGRVGLLEELVWGEEWVWGENGFEGKSWFEGRRGFEGRSWFETFFSSICLRPNNRVTRVSA